MKNRKCVAAMIIFAATCLLAVWTIGCEKAPARKTVAAIKPRAAAGLPQALAWLMAQQQADQLWHSAHYGNLKGGAAMTALVLYACSHADAKYVEPHAAALQAACDALVPEIERRGYVANLDGPDYPTYASAMLLIAAERLKLRLAENLRNRLFEYLIESQVDRAEGYFPEDPDFGGWDLEGSSRGPRKSTGTNISVSAMVSEALALRAGENEKAALELFGEWLSKCQNAPGDGGFFFHAQRDHDGNKAGWLSDGIDRTRPLSYGSATADGLRGLKACGVDPQSEPFRAAVNWCQTHSQIDQVPGFESSDDNSWSEGLLFYYWFSLAKSIEQMSSAIRPILAGQIRGELLRRQTAEGFWHNFSARMREDDPLIATSFAIIALAILDESDTSDGSD